jgi:hypothetical protein
MYKQHSEHLCDGICSYRGAAVKKEFEKLDSAIPHLGVTAVGMQKDQLSHTALVFLLFHVSCFSEWNQESATNETLWNVK